MRSPVGIAAIYLIGAIFGIVTAWQIDVRFGTHPGAAEATTPAAHLATLHGAS